MSRTSQERLIAEFDGVQIRVRGLSESLRALNRAGAAAEDMRELMHSTGEIVAAEARSRAPMGETGKLRSSIKAGRGKTKAVVRAGSARRVPYAGVTHYGWPAHNMEPRPFMLQALTAKQGAAQAHIEQGLRELLRREGLT